jgi:pimeloyl-ACP methyl ester carboxylesterase
MRPAVESRLESEEILEKENQQFSLRTGRRLGFAEYGDPQGLPLLYFHGWPSSRLEARCTDKSAAALQIRVIAVERPGFGQSDFLPDRRMAQWAQDMLEFADYLKLSRFSVLGVSGGGPYAAACAALMPERLSSVLMVCSVGPADAPGALDGMVALNRWLLTFARTVPWLAQRTASLCMKAFWGKGHQAIPRQIEEKLPPADKAVLQNPELREILTEASREALRPGVEGPAWDGFLLGQPWGFDLRSIRIPVRLWHGERDNVVPVAMGRCLAKMIPGCDATFYPEDGHFSLPYGRVEEILQYARVK